MLNLSWFRQMTLWRMKTKFFSNQSGRLFTRMGQGAGTVKRYCRLSPHDRLSLFELVDVNRRYMDNQRPVTFRPALARTAKVDDLNGTFKGILKRQ